MTEEEYTLRLAEQRRNARIWLTLTMQQARRRYWTAQEDPIERENHLRSDEVAWRARWLCGVGFQVNRPGSLTSIISPA